METAGGLICWLMSGQARIPEGLDSCQTSVKRALSTWVYPSIVREKVHDVSIFGVLRDALSARPARRNSRPWPALIVGVFLLAGSCLFAGGGRPGEGSGGLQ